MAVPSGAPEVRVRVPSPLHSYTGGASIVSACGNTLDAVLRDLDARFPGIRFRVVNEQDGLRPHMIFFVDGVKVHRLDAEVSAGGEVMLVHALSGG